MKTLLTLVNNPRKLVLPFSQNGFFKWLPDKTVLKLLYWAEMNDHLDLSNPKTFSEKIQWLKIHDRQPRYNLMVDKYRVKDYVGKQIGMEYIIPTYMVWDRPESIDFDSLPESFVIKCNHDSGGLVICRDKKSLNKEETIKKLKESFYKDLYIQSREWAYKNIEHKILAEELITDPDNKDLIDYKFYCFNGKPIYCQVIKDRNTDQTLDFYDREWKLMEFTGLATGPEPKRGTYTEKPINYEKMLEIAETLARDTYFVRIDLYNVQGKIYFGEFTLYPKSGLGKFYPDEWNIKIGNMIHIC